MATPGLRVGDPWVPDVGDGDVASLVCRYALEVSVEEEDLVILDG